jgi:protein gp37
MSDLFQPEVPDAYIVDVVKVMVEANWHTYQVLTKRSERLTSMLKGPLCFASHYRHIWWGVSVEDKRYGLPRVKHLRKANAAVKFLSVEPLLEDLGDFDMSGLHWAIVGGESGRGARPMKKDWVERILQICRDDSVAFFFKQWGGVRKKVLGRKLHGRTYDEMPTIRQNAMPSREGRRAAARLWESRSAGWRLSRSDQAPLVSLQPILTD